MVRKRHEKCEKSKKTTDKRVNPSSKSEPDLCSHATNLKEYWIAQEVEHAMSKYTDLRCSFSSEELICQQDLCVCLLCGIQVCRQSAGISHAKEHCTSHEGHCLFFQPHTKTISCAICEKDMNEEHFRNKPKMKRMMHSFSKLLKAYKLNKQTKCNGYAKRDQDLPSDEFHSFSLPYQYVGLTNEGNTCYFNSLIQCLYRLKCVRSVVHSNYISPKNGDKLKNIIKSGNYPTSFVSTELFSLFNKMSFCTENAISPNSLLKTLSNKNTYIENYYEQQDAFELFSVLMDTICEELKTNSSNAKNKNNGDECSPKTETFSPWPDKVFCSKLTSSIRCTICKSESKYVETVNSCSVSLSTENLEYLLKILNNSSKTPYKSGDFNHSEYSMHLESLSNFYNTLTPLALQHGSVNMRDDSNDYDDNEETSNASDSESEKLSTKAKEKSLSSHFRSLSLSTKLSFDNSNRRTDTCADRITYITNAAEVILIHLKRFENTKRGPSKVVHQVIFPSELDISVFYSPNNLSTDSDTECEGANYRYRLHSLVCHRGSLYSGHYTSYVRGPVFDKWTKFDDDSKAIVNFQDIPTNNVYMLFYMRIPEASSTNLKESDSSDNRCLNSPSEESVDHNSQGIPLEYPNGKSQCIDECDKVDVKINVCVTLSNDHICGDEPDI